MILVVDIGNTRSNLALFDGRRILGRGVVDTHAATATRLRSCIARLVGGRRIEEVGIASVVPAVNDLWMRSCRALLALKPCFLDSRMKLGVSIRYPRPATIGADRLANASEAHARFGGPVIVADFGTALTFDVVSRGGAYVGGVICPGLVFATDYLADRTALLPHVDLEGRIGRVGRSTDEAMKIGARIGYRGLVRELFAYLQQGTGPASLCATGGNARLALKRIGLPIVFDPDLTLKGIHRIVTMNHRKAVT